MHPYFFRIFVALHEAEAVHIDPGGKVEIPTESDPPCPEVPPIVGVQLLGGTSTTRVILLRILHIILLPSLLDYFLILRNNL